MYKRTTMDRILIIDDDTELCGLVGEYRKFRHSQPIAGPAGGAGRATGHRNGLSPSATTASSATAISGMYFDDENMSTGQSAYVRKAETFVSKSMEETDCAAVFTSSPETVTQQFTSNKQQILTALSKLLSHKHGEAVTGCPVITPYQAYELNCSSTSTTYANGSAVSEAMACHTCSDAQDCMRFVETRAATVLSLSQNYAQESLGVLGDIIATWERCRGSAL